MKGRHLLYGIFVLSAAFTAVAAYLLYSNRDGDRISPVSDSSFREPEAAARERGTTISIKAGRAMILYSGDIKGELGPCG